MKSSAIRRMAGIGALPLVLALSVAPALAHHLEGGKMPASFGSGLLSGIGHPVIGLDHFAFMAGVGIAAAFLPRGIIAVLAFVAATLAGCALHLQAVTLPGAEIAVAASVFLVGAVIMSGRALPTYIAALLFAVAGMFHGYAYGESIFGAEQTPLAAYLLGFVAIQTLVAASFMTAFRVLASTRISSLPSARLAGAMIAGIGLAFLVQNVENILLPAPPAVQSPRA
jgi:urease accessory protein